MADMYPLTPEQRTELERRGWLFWTQEEGPHAGAPVVIKDNGWTHDAQVMWEGDHWYFWGVQAAVLEFAAVAGLSVPGYVMVPVELAQRVLPTIELLVAVKGCALPLSEPLRQDFEALACALTETPRTQASGL